MLPGALRISTRTVCLIAVLGLLSGCPDDVVQPVPDGGAEVVDSGVPEPVVTCATPDDCKAAGFDGACRQGVCVKDVPCGDDPECGLGEACVSGQCRFTGCLADADCAAGVCRTEVYACTECANNEQCPASAPACTPQGQCVRCTTDAECGYPGPAYCEAQRGACVYCKENTHCPNGLSCGEDGVCVGAKKRQPCHQGISCDLGLMCVNVGANSLCLEACQLYTPKCTNGEICLKLTFQDSPSLVFDQGAPLGVCYPPFSGLRGYHEPCNDNCQPNLECVPDSSLMSSCKAYCDPSAPFCASGEVCHSLPGDYAGHRYGLCYPPNGFADECTGDGDCKAGLACVPRDDPSEFSGLSTACAFAVGTAPAMAPCATDAQCQSGSCRSDPSQGPDAFFCFAACDEDADCSAAGRTGVCDATFFFTTQYVPAPGEPVSGCRPGCASPNDCAGYGPAAQPYICTASPTLSPPGYRQVCGPQRGPSLLGEACGSNSDCRDGLCIQKDGRGVVREGVCGHPCEQAADCVPPPSTDGGTAGAATACTSVAVHLSNGGDAQPGTADDLVGQSSLCEGGACGSDSDCAAPYPVCTVDRDPADLSGALVQVCRAETLSGTKVAGDACTFHAECRSGACAFIGTSSARTCLQPCELAAPDCGGAQSCIAGGVRLARPDGTMQTFDACVP